MAYAQGGLISASDFNTFQSQIDQVYGVGFGNVGYGQTLITVPTVASGFVELIKSVEWVALRSAIETCADHQGTVTTTLPAESLLAVDTTITAHDGATDVHDIPAMLSAVTNNRLLSDIGASSTFFSVYSDSGSATWSTQTTTTVEMTFPTADDARYYFNSGGQIRFRISRSGGAATTQNTAWTNLLSSLGTLVIDYTATTSTGSGSGTAIGYYDLIPDTFQDIFTATIGGGAYTSYTGNNFRVRAMTRNVDGTNGDNGRSIRFEIQLNDTFTDSTDQVDGTINFAVDEQRATTDLTINSFVTSAITPITQT